jgi:cytochrome P450/NADPH-cytochrome P450 reductase
MSTRFNSFYHEEMHPFVGSMLDVLAESGKRAVRPPFVNQHIMRGSLKQYNLDIENLRQIAADVLAERRANPYAKKDLLSAMLDGRDPKTGEGLSDESILNNMIVFLIAGKISSSPVYKVNYQSLTSILQDTKLPADFSHSYSTTSLHAQMFSRRLSQKLTRS